MIYIALAFLDGILLIYNKPLAITLAGLLILIIIRRKVHILLTIFILCQPIISNYWFSNYENTQSKKMDWFKNDRKVSGTYSIFDIHVKNKKFILGKVQINDEEITFTYFPKKLSELKALENLPNYSNCFVLGKIKNDVTISIKPTVTFNKFDISSCKFETSNDISTYIALHKQYSLKRLRDFTPYWQNTFAMITGDVSYISPEILDVEKELGIYHLLAVSSSHVVVIAAIFYFFLNRFNVPKFTTQFLIIFTLFLFAYYTNFAPSALRAILCMTFVILLPKKFYTSLIDILSIVFILLCISSPNIIFDIGFQFSFLITFFILISSPILKSLKSIQSVLAITFISQVSSFVISAYYFNQIQWIGFFSNLLFIPYYSLILFPLAIFTYLYIQLFTTNHFLISLINFFYSLHDQYLIKMFKYFEQLRWFIGELNHVYVTYMVIWIIIIIALFTNNFIKSSIIIFIIGSILITKLTTQPQTRFTALNVGQGDSFLFETNNKHRILIDTGGKADKEGDIFEFGKDKEKNSNSISKYHIMPTLKKRGISNLDYIIITHPHADHIGELEYLINHIKIKNIIVNLQSYNNKLLYSLKDICDKNHIKLLNSSDINQITIDDNKIQFLDTSFNESKDLNDHSIMAIIKTRKYNILTTGDATVKNESKLLANYLIPRIDILKVGHHGSKTSSSEKFINSIHPHYSFISSGKNNAYKLPNKEVIGRLNKVNSQIYNTQKYGQITFNLDDEIQVLTEQ